MKNAECSKKNRKYIAGIDIGNSTTEAAVAKIDAETGTLISCFSGISKTTGIKGTTGNVPGVSAALRHAVEKAGIAISDIREIRINEAAPVIGDFAMETITETVVTDSSVIGHNPDTPGGVGLGKGSTITIKDMELRLKAEQVGQIEETAYILVVPEHVDFRNAAQLINAAFDKGIKIAGAILQKDDGVLVANRINRSIPIIDEVAHIDKIPMGRECVVEVAQPGACITQLSNPYGLAHLFDLDAQETKAATAIARALIGIRSAVVIKTPKSDVKERVIQSGSLLIIGSNGTGNVDVKSGAVEIMTAVNKCKTIMDVKGTPGTNAGGMIENIRIGMSKLIHSDSSKICISDILAVDTVVPREVRGNVAGEFFMEHAVGLAAMIKTEKYYMDKVAAAIAEEIQVPVKIGGVEAEMAVIGALTTPGTGKPVVIIDIGAGSTDICYMDKTERAKAIHLAGAGNMVTMLINAELGLNDMTLAEEIKKHPLAKVESFYHIRHENGAVQFFDHQLDSKLYGRTVIINGSEMTPIQINADMEKIRSVRRNAKQKVLVQNALRGLKKVSPTGDINHFDHVVLLGGSALDFELGNMITEKLAYYGVSSGQANVRGCEGPRNAVATGLIYTAVEVVGRESK